MVACMVSSGCLVVGMVLPVDWEITTRASGVVVVVSGGGGWWKKTFRMARPLFNRIVSVVTNHDPYFHNNIDCTGRECISPLIKCTSVIRQLAYGVNASFLDEYMQISERSSHMALDHFCKVVMEIYGPEFLRKSTVIDIEKLYRHHKEKHGFPGIYPSGYYLVDEIYPELAPLVKTIPEPDDDHKRILYKQNQESARKDVERVFGVLKKK
ncbi:zf-CCHC domain-containing protein [Tanacetum coccineum]|uniref:Zf-CCHC domain-containing protein n=1 Tax=Tanacetum coccineum TaxID=301880 RepID=A0ABQ5AQH6_9ASTR